MKTLFIYGAGGFGRETLEIVEDINTIQRKWTKVYFIDDFNSNRLVNGVQVVDFTFFKKYIDVHRAASIVIATADPRSRSSIAKKLRDEDLYKFIDTIISPHARVSRSSVIGPGSIICAGVQISVNVEIDSNCLINCHSIIGHDVRIMENTVVSSQVNLGGNTNISSEVFVGMGSLIREGVNLGSGAFIGMASSVHSDIPPGILAVGNPARPIRKVEQLRLYNN